MPNCGSQIILCDLPVRFDTYNGCSHGCKYCFVTRKADISKISNGEGPEALRHFIAGRRTGETDWCDWDIPLHWGGCSDPFQPVELERGLSMACLRVFAETQYPFVVSTKGTGILTRPEYLDVIKRCNAVIQVSMVAPMFDALEPGAPTFEQRLNALPALAANSKRLIVRIQPYVREAKGDIIKRLPQYRDAGVYGITIEGIKYFNRRPGMVKCGGDFVYPVDVLERDYLQIRAACQLVGIHFFCAENRLRQLGEDLCCCGIAGLSGFHGNRANLIHMLAGDAVNFTDKMMSRDARNQGFKALAQTTAATKYFRTHTFAEIMEALAKDRKVVEALKK